MKPHFALPFVLALAPTLAFAGQIDVPGDYSDLQTAIDNANPGDVILIHGGTWGGVVVDKPLTLLGDPKPTIEGRPLPGEWGSPITLAGPGSGEVTLANLDIGGMVSGIIYGKTLAGISGGGFLKLHVYDSEVSGPEWFALTGSADGGVAIDVTVPLVTLERVTATATKSDIDVETFLGIDGVDAIRTTGTVVLLDSVVTGGTSGPYFMIGNECLDCPCGGLGGIGIVCDTVYQSGSSVAGGAGAEWFTNFGSVSCGFAADGAAYAVNAFHLLPGDLEGSGAPTLGGVFELSFYSPPPSALLFGSFDGMSLPTTFGGVPGFLFANLAGGTFNLGAVNTPGSTSLAIPAIPALAGTEVLFQSLHGVTGLSRPVSGVLLP